MILKCMFGSDDITWKYFDFTNYFLVSKTGEIGMHGEAGRECDRRVRTHVGHACIDLQSE